MPAEYIWIDLQEIFTVNWLATIGAIGGAAASAFAAWTSLKIAREVRNEQRANDAAEADVVLSMVTAQLSTFAVLIGKIADGIEITLHKNVPEQGAATFIADPQSLSEALALLISDKHLTNLTASQARFSKVQGRLGVQLAQALSEAQSVQHAGELTLRQFSQATNPLRDRKIYNTLRSLIRTLRTASPFLIDVANQCRARMGLNVIDPTKAN